MILRKTMIEGKEVFEPISLEEALKVNDKNELLFTSSDIEEAYDERKLVLDDEVSTEDEDVHEESTESSSFTFDFGKEFSKIGDSVRNIFIKEEGKRSKSSQIISTLPFLDDDALDKIVDNVMEKKDDYKDLNLVIIFPFLSKEKMDALFLKLIDEKETAYISSAAPFVTEDVLTKFVDSYIEGQHKDINIDSLYPFMSPYDVKRIFNYIINQKETNVWYEKNKQPTLLKLVAYFMYNIRRMSYTYDRLWIFKRSLSLF